MAAQVAERDAQEFRAWVFGFGVTHESLQRMAPIFDDASPVKVNVAHRH